MTTPETQKSLTCNLWLLFHMMISKCHAELKTSPAPPKKKHTADARAHTLVSACWQSRSTTKKFAGSVNGFHDWEVPHLHPKGTRQEEAGLHWNEAARLQQGTPGWLLVPGWAMMFSSLSVSKCIEDMLSQPLSVFLIDAWTSYLIAWK